mgnify:CR=1 FL=1
MDERRLRELVEGLVAGDVQPDDAVAQLRRLPFAEVGDTLVDHHRALRQGMPEAVYGRGKTAAQCIEIVGELLKNGDGPVLLTRVDDRVVDEVSAAHPGAEVRAGSMLWRRPEVTRAARVLVMSAGTSDVPVVDECVLTLGAYGFEPDRLTDVGVAGLHRLLAHLDRVTAADAVVVVAEQSVGAIVSAAELVQELKKREIDRPDLHLLVSRFDPDLGVDAAQIAERIGVASVDTLPDRRAALVQAANRGVVLADDAPADAYVRAVGALMERLGYHAGQPSERGLLARIKEKLPEALRVARIVRAGN